MESRGVEEIFYFQVDNVLMRVGDPVYVGLHHDVGSEMSCKVLMKRDPYEKLGVVVRTGNRVEVIEYSDLPEDMAVARDSQGRLRYAAGSIAIHAFGVDFVKRVVGEGAGLPWHLAHKKVPYVDENGKTVTPQEPNAYKFERFIFDALPMAGSMMLMEGNRADDFAPVKQASGEDSPESAARALVEQAARWLESAGVKVPRGEDGLSRYPLEISPMVALEEEDLLGKVAKGLVINGPMYFGPEK
jgi:UDP-N-acetylglucosamine/UDP-N-acetylgalactosamine diphosphorylase